ncbi:MAG: hypothetical protein P1U42_01210 [Phycisphaerales bacterium]|nr:hypothetical protein [Phycisphaerales bacterium]
MSDQKQEQLSPVTSDCAKAPINPRWALKLSVITIVIFIVGAWGFWDASSVYPKRGERYAQWAKWQYLEQSKRANSEDFGIFIRDTSVANPSEEYTRLNEPETQTRNLTDAQDSSSNRNLRASMLVARMNWLDALKVIGHLDPEYTVIETPERELETLKLEWQSAKLPKPLSNFDLIVQWMIMAVCWTVALLMFVHILKVKTKKYAWVSDTMALTLPNGGTITPDDLEEVDKRKWDKFIVFLKIKSSHDSLGGKEISVDTYQHLYVEEWILAMEEKAFPSQEDENEAETAPAQSNDSSEPSDSSATED